MRDLGGALVERDQARVGEPLEHSSTLAGDGALGDELVDRHAPPRVLDPLTELGHPQEHAARQRVAASSGSASTTASAVRAMAEATPPLSR